MLKKYGYLMGFPMLKTKKQMQNVSSDIKKVKHLDHKQSSFHKWVDILMNSKEPYTKKKECCENKNQFEIRSATSWKKNLVVKSQ